MARNAHEECEIWMPAAGYWKKGLLPMGEKWNFVFFPFYLWFLGFVIFFFTFRMLLLLTELMCNFQLMVGRFWFRYQPESHFGFRFQYFGFFDQILFGPLWTKNDF